MRRDGRFALLLVALWATPVLLLAGALTLQSTLERAAVTEPGPLLVTVGSQTDDRRQPVAVIVERQPGEVVAARIDGLVTAVEVRTPAAVTAGMPLARVDDALIRAQTGAAPIVRDVAPGSRGPDVGRVRELLAATGYDVGEAPADAYSFALRRAIDAWNADAGLPRDGVFRVSSTAFVPAAVTELTSTPLAVGDRIAVSEPLAVGADTVVRLGFASVSDQPLFDYGDAETVLIVGADALPVVPGTIEGDAARAIVAALDEAVGAGAATIVAEDDELRYGSVSLALAAPEVSATLPTAAVLLDQEGRRCIFVVPADSAGRDDATALADAEPRALDIAEPLSGAAALTAVDADLAGATVVADATRLPSGRSCASA